MASAIRTRANVNARGGILDLTVRDYVKAVWTKHAKILGHARANKAFMAPTASTHAVQDVSIRSVMRHRARAHAWTTISESCVMKHALLFALNVSRPQYV